MKRITRTLIFTARRLCTLAASVTAHLADSLDFLSKLLSEDAANSPAETDSKNEVEYDPPRQLDDAYGNLINQVSICRRMIKH